MTDDDSSLAGFLVAPLVPAIGFAISSPGLGGGFNASIGSLVALSAIAYLVSLLAVGLLALPVFLFLRMHGFSGLRASSIAGVGLGLLVACVFAPLPYTPWFDWFVAAGVGYAYMGFAGGAAGLTFWSVRSLCMRAGKDAIGHLGA